MKNSQKKLVLKKKTVFSLTNNHLKNVKGGKGKMINLPIEDPIETAQCTVANCATLNAPGCISIRC